MADHQDWEPVTFVNTKLDPQQKKHVIAERRPGHNNLSKKLEGDEPPPPKMYDAKLRNEMTSLRLKLKLNQKTLANRLHVTESVIKNLENGTGKYDPQLVNKIRRLAASGSC